MTIETVEQLIEWMAKISRENNGSRVHLIVEQVDKPGWHGIEFKVLTNVIINEQVTLLQFHNTKAVDESVKHFSQVPPYTLNMNVIIREIEEAITKKREEYRENQKQRTGNSPDPTRERLPGTETPGGQERQ